MNERDYILAVHRWRQRRADAIADLVIFTLVAAGYGLWRLIEWCA